MKCAAPSAAGISPRTRLFALLEPDGGKRMAWMSSPAGSGKSSVLSSYLLAQPRPWLWYQVDESDADPASLFVALLEAAASMPDPAMLPTYDPSCEKRLRAFSRQFAAALVARAGGELVLALDDFHVAPRLSHLGAVLRDMLDAAPGLRVLVASRLGPPAALARMRMHGQVTIVSWPDLRLTIDEAGELLADQGGPSASSDGRLASLHRASDGWAAGLLLLAQHEVLPETGLPPDSPERGLLADYLSQEVLGHASSAQRRALTATALLPEFDEQRVAALLQDEHPGDLLRELQLLPFFVRRQDPVGSMWTHHPLVRTFLLDRFETEFAPAEAASLRRRAARLMLVHGDIDAGLRVLHEHGSVDELSTAVLAHAAAWTAQGRAASVEAWIARLPDERVLADPWLQLTLGKARMQRSPTAAIEPLERAAQAFRSQGERRGCLLACAAIAEAVGYGYAELKRLEPWLAEAAALVPELNDLVAPHERAEVMGALFAALVARQRPHPLLPVWRELALTLSQRSKQPTLQAQVLFAATMSHVWTGDYAAAGRLGERLREVLSDPGVAALPRTTGWLVLSVLAGNQPGPVPDYRDVEAGLGAARETGVHVWDAELHGQAAVIALCHGDRKRAGVALALMQRCLPPGASVHSAGYHCFSAWRRLLADEPAAAMQAAAAGARDAAVAGSEPLARHAAVMAAQAALALEQPAEAHRHLASLADGGERNANPRGRFVRLLLEAELARRAGRVDEALASLHPALSLGREAGYVAYYGWQPKLMAALATLALRHGIETDYVRMLIRLRGLTPDGAALDMETWPWTVRVSTLGALRIEGLPPPAKPGLRTPQKPIDLLLAVVALGDRDVPEASVCDALWPDAEGDAARRALDVTLHRTRRLFADANAVTLAAGKLQVDDKKIWIDVRALEPLLDRIADADEPTLVDLDGLLDLYRGSFLRDESAAWAVQKRTQLRRRFAAVVSRRLRALLERGQAAEALSRALRACEAEPDERSLAAVLAQVEAAAGSCV